ncbi:MAG: GntR family transcriptional regulator [Limnochordia bacterium]|jgi:DNA-binding GntR family transcriptional regulator
MQLEFLSGEGSLKDQVYHWLRQRIITWDLRPGELLSEKMVADELGLSRTPVREALQRLQQQGLVKVIPRRGVVVSDISIADLREIFQLREAIESYAVWLVTPTISLEELKALIPQEPVEETQRDRWLEQDCAFHNFLVEQTGNARMGQILADLNAHIQRFRVFILDQPGRMREVFLEHHHIVDAISQRDPDRAAACMRDHIRKAREVGLALL